MTAIIQFYFVHTFPTSCEVFSFLHHIQAESFGIKVVDVKTCSYFAVESGVISETVKKANLCGQNSNVGKVVDYLTTYIRNSAHQCSYQALMGKAIISPSLKLP